MTVVLPLVALLAAAGAGGGSEVVLILDNSCSMGVESREANTGRRVPPNDPERAAVLGSLIVEGLARGSADEFSLLAFGNDADDEPLKADTADDIRALPYSSGTFFRRPLEEAGTRLKDSQQPRRLFLFFTDGAPEDLDSPEDGPAALGLGEGTDFETLVIGLFGSAEARRVGEVFLTPLARDARDLVFVNQPREVVSAFTRGYARVLGSRPETGTLSAGQTRTFEVGRYVVEVLVATASAEPGEAYAARLEGPKGGVAVQASGDNGCGPGMPRYLGAPRLCRPPHRHYQVFRAANDPDAPSRWTLSLPSAPGDVDYGLILRYDLEAALAVPPKARVGEEVTLEARLLSRGRTFDDEAFFGADGFEAVATVEGEEVRLKHAGGGRFTGVWTPSRPSNDGRPVPVRVAFRNNWMEQRARAGVVVEGFLPLTLVPRPATMDLGQWRGERRATRRCEQVDLSGSTNADRIAVTCTPRGQGEGGAISCAAVEGSEADLGEGRKGQPLRYEVCFEAEGCCKELEPVGLGVTFAATHPHYAAAAVVVPAAVRVEATGWLRCWWLYLVLGGAALFLGWVTAGFVRPYDFDAAASVYVAGSEAGLRRASALVLREVPGGRRGFYRSARMCLTASGDYTRSPRAAAVALEAGPGGSTRFLHAAGLERKAPRSGKWEAVPPEDLKAGYMPGTLYRAGNLYLKWN